MRLVCPEGRKSGSVTRQSTQQMSGYDMLGSLVKRLPERSF